MTGMALDVVTVGVVCADVMVRPVEAFPERGRAARVPLLEMHLGGLASVAAAVVSQLGGRAAFIGCAGQDGFGDYVVGAMAARGVDVGQVRRTSEESTSATVVLIGEDGERTFLHHVGANRLLKESDVDLDFVARARILHWAGPSATPGLDGAPIARVLEQARARGVKTSVDTCFDATGAWLPLMEAALPHLDIVMTSFEEARHYTGQDDPEAMADFFRGYGVETVLVKLGAEGLFVKGTSGTHALPAHPVEVVDTTGAGDAACGAFLYGYARRWSLLQCGRLANAVGGLTVRHMGGAEALRSVEQLRDILEAV